jgi:hypothetical protein
MSPALERELWDWTRDAGVGGGNTPRQWIEQALSAGKINSPKQAWATLTKWSAKGWYDYGVNLDLGWIWPEHRAHGPHPGHASDDGCHIASEED